MTRKKKLLFTVAGLILIFILAELAVRVVVLLAGIGPLDPRERELVGRANLKIYENEEWADEYYLKELKSLSSRLNPFVGFVPKERSGKYINIDLNGMRRTWNPEATENNKVSIFVFGGSTTWGAGARDEYTIPSFISKILNENALSGTSYIVSNYGQSGYTSVQETAKLARLLHEGKRPDAVIFYDGVNDTSYAYESGIPGAEGGRAAIENLFRSRLEKTFSEKLSGWAKEAAKKYCVTCRVIWNTIREESPEFLSPTTVAGQSFTKEEVVGLASGIAEGYKGQTLALLNGLSRAFDFELAVFWQPTLFTEDELIGEERELGKLDAHVNDEKAAELYRLVDGFLEGDPGNNFYNITDVLHGRSEEYYIDFGHISEKGNEVVARKIVEILKENNVITN